MEKEISFIYTGYIMHYLNPVDTIKWADKKIMDGNSRSEIIDISLSDKDENVIISSLNILRKNQTSGHVDLFYLSLYNLLFRKKLLTWMIIVEEIFRLFTNGFIETDDNDFFFSGLCDYYSLRKYGYTGNMDMPGELKQFLSCYNEDIQLFKDLNFHVRGIYVRELSEY
jgi:hypothetical protein